MTAPSPISGIGRAGHKKAITPESVRRILIVKLSSLGDILHALPTVAALKAAHGATIDWLVQPAYVPLVSRFNPVDRVMTFPRREFARHAFRFWAELRRERYDLVVDLQGLLKSAWPARLARRNSGAPCVGPSFHREGTRMFYTSVAGPRNKNRHAVEENLDVIRWLGWVESPVQFPMQFPRMELQEPPPRVVIVPASRWATKNWPADYFSDLIRRLLVLECSVVLAGGKEEAGACGDIERSVGPGPGLLNMAGKTTLIELGSLLQAANLVVTVDSGPMHLAAALGTPVLALFGPTDPTRTGPYGRNARVLWADGLPCRPCFSDRCERHDFACLRQIYPSRVLDEVLRMLRPR